MNGLKHAATAATYPRGERRGEHLKLPYRLQGDGVRDHLGERAARARATGQSSQVEVGVRAAVDLEAVEPLVLSADREAAERPEGDERVECCRDAQVPCRVRQGSQL